MKLTSLSIAVLASTLTALLLGGMSRAQAQDLDSLVNCATSNWNSLPLHKEVPDGAPVTGLMNSATVKRVTGIRPEYVDTRLLSPEMIGYDGYPLPTRTNTRLQPRLPDSLQAHPKASVASMEPLIPAGKFQANSSLVTLSTLDDGRLVVTKSPIKTEEMLMEANSLKILSELEMGPRYHGIWHEPKTGKNFFVMDLVTGDFDGATTAKTFDDVERFIVKSRENRVNVPINNLQYYHSKDGRIAAIDNADFSEKFDPSRFDLADAEEDYAKLRARFLKLTDPSTRSHYLENLRTRDRAAYDRVIALSATP